MPIAKLSIDLEARVASFENELKKAANAAEAQSQRMAKAFGIAKAGFVGLASSITVGALTEFVRRTVDGIDKLNDLSDATGASIENLSALEDVAVRTGTSMDTVGAAVVKLNKALGDAKGGTEQAAAFKAIGLSVEELKRLDPAEALRRVAVSLSGFAEDGNKARLVQELFGKSIREVAPLLNDLASKTQLLGTVTTEQAKAAEKFNQELAGISKNASDAARALVGDYLPALNKILEAIGKGGLKAGVNQLGELLGLGAEYYATRSLKIVADDLKLLELQFQTAPKGPGKSQLGRELDAMRVEYEQVRALYLKVRGIEEGKADPGFRASQNYGDTTKPKLPDVKLDPEIEKARQAYLKLAQAIGQATTSAAEEIVNGEKLSPLQQVRVKILQDLSDGEIKFTAAQKQSINAALEGLDILDRDLKLRNAQRDVREHSAKLTEQELADLAREAAARLQSNEQLRQQIEEFGKTAEQIEALRIARMEDAAAQEEINLIAAQSVEGNEAQAASIRLNIDALRDQIALRKRLQQLDTEARTDATKGAQRAFDAYLEQIKNAGDATEAAVGRSISTLEDDMVSSLARGKLNFKSFIDTVISEALRLQVVRPLLNSLFGAAGSASGGGLGGLGAFVGSFFGSGNVYSGDAPDDWARSHRSGLDRVPYDGYRAILHKDERVQTAREARQPMAAPSVTFIFNGEHTRESEMRMRAYVAQGLNDYDKQRRYEGAY